jgi:beta-N-acetylhexosaminidase
MMHTKMRPGPVMIDLAGTALSDDERRRIAHPLVGGVILFKRNFVDRAQLTALTSGIRDMRRDALIAVDHEGGRVQRFRTDGFTQLPTMRSIGALHAENPGVARALADAAGYVMASELRACGVDLSFAPVLDLDYDVSAAIGDRAFHVDPDVVAALAGALIGGMARAGMANCGKHFPGHGHVEADTHHASAVDPRPLERILRADARPYDDARVPLAAVMPAHVIYLAVDDRPAGFSRIWLYDILRSRLKFSGAIISDDLSMEAAGAAGDVLSRARAALGAGCDMALVCNRPDQADAVLDGLDVQQSSESRARIVKLFPTSASPGWEALVAEPDYQACVERLRAVTRA